MLAAARPLPSEETTPPVMKMYLGVRSMILSAWCRRRQKPPHLIQVLGRVHFERFVLRLHRFDANTVLERPQLLERLGSLERGRLERRQDQQNTAAIGVQADMSIERRPSGARVAEVRNRRAGEIQGKPAAI